MQNIFPGRAQLFRWIGWFFFINSLIAFSAIFYYHSVIPDFAAVYGANIGYVILAWVFYVLCFWVQCAAVLFFGGLICFLLALLWPRRIIFYPLALSYAALILIAVAIEAVTYVLFRQHYAGVGLEIAKSHAFADVLVLGTPEKLSGLLLITVFLILEYFIGRAIWKRILQNRSSKSGYICSAVLGVSAIFVYGLMTVAARFPQSNLLSPVAQHEVLKASRVPPYFSELFDLIIPGDKPVRFYHVQNQIVPIAVKKIEKPLNYPLQPLHCAAPKKPYNILIIAIDTWRYTEMNPQVTPAIYQFAQQSLQFDKHYSGGNCTQPGIFSLFYGLPANYWDAFFDQQKRPVLINQLMRDNYQFGIYASAPLNFPAFNRTVFEGVNPLIRIEGDSSIDRDIKVTQDFTRFLSQRDQTKPFFGFLFYDAVHNYCEPQVPSKTPFQPYINACNRVSLTPSTPQLPYLNRYRNAVHFDDEQVGQVLATLKQEGLLKNTIVIITADHGEQLNDEHMGIWVHASAYTKYQLHIPFIVSWPGKAPQRFNYFTTHNDVAPTLLSQALNCSTPFADYSEGQSLFSNAKRPLFIVGSYGDYAIVTPERAERIYPNGDYQIDDARGHPIPDAQLDPDQMRAAYQQLMKFYQK